MTTYKQIVMAMLAAELIDPEFLALNEWERDRRAKFGRVDPLDQIESLEIEYQLIKDKKSKLSRADRDRVVYIVEHMEDIPDEHKTDEVTKNDQ